MQPLATNLALYLSADPSTFNLILNTHLQPIGTLPGGKVVMTQVLFACKASISACIASCHLGSKRA